MYRVAGRFHSKNGLCFSRLDDGSVCVEMIEGPDPLGPDAVPVCSVMLDPSSWSSIVAHVSHAGESHETHSVALKTHMGG